MELQRPCRLTVIARNRFDGARHIVARNTSRTWTRATDNAQHAPRQRRPPEMLVRPVEPGALVHSTEPLPVVPVVVGSKRNRRLESRLGEHVRRWRRHVGCGWWWRWRGGTPAVRRHGQRRR